MDRQLRRRRVLGALLILAVIADQLRLRYIAGARD